MPQPATASSRWQLPAWTGSSRYRFSRHVQVAGDSAGSRTLVFDTAGTETFTHRATARGNVFTIAEGGESQNAAQISATLVDGQLSLANEGGGSTQCDASRNQLRSDLVDLASRVPSALSARMSWTDSATVGVCVGGSPGTARTIRRFTVLGDTALNETRAVIVSRRDSTSLTADGLLEQHPTSVNGTAVANVLLYLSEASGKVVRVNKEQVLLLSVTAEGTTKSFVQKLTSIADLVR